MNNTQIQSDVRDNKVKEGMLLKQSRHLKEWKDRWMVLTKTHLYSFTNKGQYKQATQIIDLKDVETIKSYYKDQYKKPYTFRVQSLQVNLHMSAKSNDEKWAWMTAIEKMIDRVNHPQTKVDTYNLIRETIKMSNAARQTLQKKQQKERKQSGDFSNNILKRIKMAIDSLTVHHQIYPQTYVKQSKFSEQQQDAFFIMDKKKVQKPKPIVQEINHHSPQKVAQKIVQVPVERIVQKIIRVPQIREKIVEKIIYKESPKGSSNQELNALFKTLIQNPGQNPRPLIQFVVYLLTSKHPQYQPQVLQFLNDPESKRFFAEVFLLMMNEQTDQQIMNSYLKFILVLYENCEEFFYISDLKALIGILIRQIQMNRSEFNQYLIMLVLKAMAQKQWWSELNYRRSQIKGYIRELEAVSGPQNQYLASNLLQKL